MESCVIIIPVHKADPSKYELISFQQCFKILYNHSIYVIAPAQVDLSAYHKVIPNFKVIRISSKWQSNLLNYNKLKLSMFFCNLFGNYKYLLTYELDAFIFKDNLDYWCDKDYDYIGAPWFEGYGENPGEKLIGMGNSGFSLRKLSTIKKGLKAIYYPDPTVFQKPHGRWYVNNVKQWYIKVASAFAGFVNLFFKENPSIQRSKRLDEDRVIIDYMAKKVTGFKLAPVNEAATFSFEVKPEVLYAMNKQSLPMGCHAWWRYNLEFWKPFIEQFGYQL